MSEKSKATLMNVVLREALITSDYITVINSAGSCLMIEAASWDTTDNSEPGEIETPDETETSDETETPDEVETPDEMPVEISDNSEPTDGQPESNDSDTTGNTAPTSEKSSGGSDGCSLLII